MDESEHPQREYVEATVIVPDYLLERFLDFCEEELAQVPSLSHVTDDLDGQRDFYERLASKLEDRLEAKIPRVSRN